MHRPHEREVQPAPDAPRDERRWVGRVGAVLVYVGWTLVFTIPLRGVTSLQGLSLLACAGALALLFMAMLGAASGSRRAARDLLGLLALPALGSRLLSSLAPDCDVTVWMNVHFCNQEPGALRPLAIPQVYDLVALHLAACASYVAARRNPNGLHDRRAEFVVRALLLTAAGAHVAVIAQVLNPVTQTSVAFPADLDRIAVKLGGLLASVPSAVLFMAALWARPGRAPAPAAVARPSEAPDATPRNVPWRGPASYTWPATAMWTVAVIALYCAITAALHGRAWAALEPFSQTCGYVFSRRAVAVHCPIEFGFNCCRGEPESVVGSGAPRQ